MVNNRQKTFKKIIVSVIIAIFIFSIGSTFMLYMFGNEVDTTTNNQSRTQNSSNIEDNINLEFDNPQNIESVELENNESNENSGIIDENTSDDTTQLTGAELNEIQETESN
ncbi:MAG: hypothetical protein V3575_00585 [Candidatus Absconditabacteria bacterium]